MILDDCIVIFISMELVAIFFKINNSMNFYKMLGETFYSSSLTTPNH